MGIDTHREPVIYLPRNCPVCRSEGFSAMSRVQVERGGRIIIATVNTVSDELLPPGQAGLSDTAWLRLGAREGSVVWLRHADNAESLGSVRGKLYGNRFSDEDLRTIINDITSGQYSDVQTTAFVTACAGQRLDRNEVLGLTAAMVGAGSRLAWDRSVVVDKHCVGGLPGNRTTPILVAIVAAAGLCMPKTSSRAITSPAGTADTMETLAPVDLSFNQIRQVVEQEGACIAWGGLVSLSPADASLLAISRVLGLESEGQMVASVLSKKVAAGSTHVLIDLPVGATAKIRSMDMGLRLAANLQAVGRSMGLTVRCLFSDGEQPVGKGIGPALEARDVVRVLRNDAQAPADLRSRSLALAAELLEMGGKAAVGEGLTLATEILQNGSAWRKFIAICEAQGGLREPGQAAFQHTIEARQAGRIGAIDNQVLAKLAKLCGAPDAPAAGLYLQMRLGDEVERGQPLFTLHAESRGELNYALDYFRAHPQLITIAERMTSC